MTGPVRTEDVLEQRGDPVARVPPWLRRLAAAAALVLAVVLATQSGLLSSDRRPAARPRPAATPTAADRSVAPAKLIVREGPRLVRYSEAGRQEVAELPWEVAPEAPLWAVDDAGHPATVYGVGKGELIRVDVRRGRVIRNVGTVQQVVGVGPGAGELVIQVADGNRSRVVVVEAASGNVVDRDLFPGFDGTGNWTPRGAMTTFGLPGLVLTRPGAQGRDEVAVAWPRRGVTAGFVPSLLQQYGSPGMFLGLAEDWVLFLDESCPSAACALSVLSFTRDGANLRKVAPPDGWWFSPGATRGQSHEALVPVLKADDLATAALARVVAGGDNALLLRKSVGLLPEHGLVAEPDGSVYFVMSDRLSSRLLARWSPVESPHLVTFPELPQLSSLAQLVCACD